MQKDSGTPTPGTQTTTGLAPNVAAALSYLLWGVTGLIFALIERNNQFVRFHAWQSILLTVAWIALQVAWTILNLILGTVPVLGFLLALLGILVWLVLGLGAFVLWIVLMVRAYQGQRLKLPLIGEYAERYAVAAPF